MASWLPSRRVRKVAMEPTSVYRLPVYEVLDRAGSGVMPGPPRMTKRISGGETTSPPANGSASSCPTGFREGRSAPTTPPSLAVVCPAGQAHGRGPLAPRPSHAEGDGGEGRPARQRERRHHRGYGPGRPRGHRWWRTRSATPRVAPRRADPGRRRADRGQSRGTWREERVFAPGRRRGASNAWTGGPRPARRGSRNGAGA